MFCTEFCVDTNSLSCECCDHWYHLKFCGVKGEDSFLVKTLMRVLGWTCRACRIDSFGIIKKLQTEVGLLRSAQLLQTEIDTNVVVAKDTSEQSVSHLELSRVGNNRSSHIHTASGALTFQLQLNVLIMLIL